MGDVVEERISTEVPNVNLNKASLATNRLRDGTSSRGCTASLQSYACQSCATWQGLYIRDAILYTLSEHFAKYQPR